MYREKAVLISELICYAWDKAWTYKNDFGVGETSSYWIKMQDNVSHLMAYSWLRHVLKGKKNNA